VDLAIQADDRAFVNDSRRVEESTAVVHLGEPENRRDWQST
jgi:hypothetical protein